MRSLITFAAFVAAIGFSGCCSTGGSCPVSHGGKLGCIGKTAASATHVQNVSDQAVYSEVGDCGCGAPAYDEGMLQSAHVQSDCGCGAPVQSDCGCGAPVQSDCGCGAPAADAGAAACACGSDSVVTVSAPYDCDGSCGAAMPAASEGGCGCNSGSCGGDQAMPVMSDGGCGCSSCGDSAPVYSPMQYSAPAAVPASAPAAGGCTTCQGASTAAPEKEGRFFAGRGLDKSGQGMGMMIKDRGMACNSGEAQPSGSLQNFNGAERRADRRSARSLKPQRTKKTLAERFGFAKNEVTGGDVETIDLVSNDCLECGDAGGRHISHGFISDVQNARQATFGDRPRHAGQGHFGGHGQHGDAGCQGGSCLGGAFGNAFGGGGNANGGSYGGGGYGGGGYGSGGLGGGGYGARAHGANGCLGGGCGHGGKLCGVCSKLRALGGVGSGNPYGGAIPHTTQQPGRSGLAPQYAYPYYTTRGPRDFLQDNPPSIGR